MTAIRLFRCSLQALALAALLAGSASPGQAALPAYIPKPVTWQTMLIDKDGGGITDVMFAQIVAAEQAAAAGLKPAKDFSLIASFTQCYSGGFVSELFTQGVNNFGANSACRFYQTASYDVTRSFYSWAWSVKANVPAPLPNDFMITDQAYAALQNGAGAINRNPRWTREQAQYLSVGAPPEVLHSAPHNYAILFVGAPDPLGRDAQDVSNLYAVLTGQYGYMGGVGGDIWILYGAGAAPAGVAWGVNGAASAANLQAAFNTWLHGKLMGQANPHAQVFFYAGDHGDVDHPITVAVDGNTVGQPGTGVQARRAAGLPVGNALYSAGVRTNVALVELNVNVDFKGLSFGDDFDPAVVFNSPYGVRDSTIYFGVDRQSKGLAGSDVRVEATTPGRNPAPDIYMLTANNSNRKIIDGARTLGLMKAAGAFDELNDFVMRDLAQVMNPATGLPTIPVFFTVANGPTIYVFDPMLTATYPYYTWPAADVAAPPVLVDALALADDGVRDPVTNQLSFNKANDYLLLSVGKAEVAAPWNGFAPCDVIKFGGGAGAAVWATCNQLGLDPMTDNVDGLDLGNGPEGQPMDLVPYPKPPGFPPYYPPPYPSYPYPSYPYPPNPKTPPVPPGTPLSVEPPS